ncbi:putative uncharacterized protein DDB_G0282133 isoform X2 [Hyposmocoma kahamanoa]|uniref:putative uncharacterized protein DDB_G0282133 isoform X2 n=1 Tax=Hyposmocoma kahamanoa TaxID=1477025 RepID=UPI000E6DA39C|nr:putative uncharacterized protein DDB_G0282133 isoform X2 [Hyposmocoma kahamanoa]
MEDSTSNIGFIDSETLQEEFGDDVDSETLQRLMQVWLKKIHLKSAEFNAFSEIMLAKMEVHLAMKELKVSIFKKTTRKNRGSSNGLRSSSCFRQKQTTLDKSRAEENSTACTTLRGQSNLHTLDKSSTRVTKRKTRNNHYQTNKQESQSSEDDNATAEDSITTTRSADDSDVHMKTLTDITDLETDNFNGHTEPNVNNIAFPVIETIQPANSYISNFDNLPLTFANAQSINLIDQHTIPNTGNTIQDLNNNNPNMTSYNFRSDLNPTCAQMHQYNFNMTTDSVQPNSNHTFYAQNYVNTRGNNNTVCSVIPCNVPPICAPRVNTSYTSAVENCIYPIENVFQGLQSIPTEVNNYNCLTANFQQFNSQNIFDGPNSNSSRTVIGGQLNKIHETLRNNIICNAISTQTNDNRRNIQTETGTQKETANTIAPTTNVIAKSTLTSNFAFNSVSSIRYEEISRKSSTDSNQLIINEDPIDSTEAMPEDITQDLVKIWYDFSPGKKAVILKSQAVSKSQTEIPSNDKTALNCSNNTQYQRNLQSEFNLESQTNLASQSCLNTQSSLESQSTEPSTNNNIPEINIKKRRGSLLLEALKIEETANTNDKNCQKSKTTPLSRRHSKSVRRNVKDSIEPLADCNSENNSTNKESLPSVIVVKNPIIAESTSLMQNSPQRKESTPKADTVAKKDTTEKFTLTHQFAKPTGNNVNFKDGDKDKSSKENREKKSSKHRNKSRSSKRKKTDNDRNDKEKPYNSKKMDVRKKDRYERQNFNSNSNVIFALNQHQAGPRSYYRYINDYDWPYYNESYNHYGDVRSNHLDTTYSQVNYNYRVPDWPYDTTTNFRRNKYQVSEERRSKKTTVPKRKESVLDPKQPPSSKATDKTDVTDTLSKKGTTLDKPSSKPAKQPKKYVGHTSKNQTPPKKISRLNNITKTTNNVETTQDSANGKKSPVYVFRDGTFCGIYHTENPTSPDPEMVETTQQKW